MLSEIASPRRTHAAWFHLYEASRRVKLWETESRETDVRTGEKGKGEWLFNGNKASVIQEE